MFLRMKLASALALALAVWPVHAQQPPQKPAPSSELDAFMERVLARRDVNRKVLNDYILDESEGFEVLGPGRFPLHRSKREYTWFVRDGIHVRSPLRYDGVSLPEEARVQYEERWLRREKHRAEQRRKKAEEKAAGKKAEEAAKGSGEIAVSGSGISISSGAVRTEPQFVSEAYFMDFKFEPGNYYLAGREQLEGQEVLKIEYYPTRLFGGDDDEKTPRELKEEKRDQRRDRDRDRELEQDIERKMNKTALITLWVDPKEHQIVKYTFENVWLDFLPAAWLVRVDSMRASMGMFQPFPGVWLPRGIDISAGITLANGSYEASYQRRFADYRQADVKSKIRIPKTETLDFSPGYEHPPEGSGPFVPEDAPLGALSASVLQETIREIRVHGNAAVPDAEVLRIAGIAVGAPIDASALAAIETRLKDSGRFESVEVRKRYRSIADPTDVALVLVVHEKTGVIATAAGGIERPVLRRVTSRVMFLPILSYADGYGFTYGARFSTVDLLGVGERLSVPLTWGGTRRVALEAERTFKRGPLTRVLGSAALWQRQNPGFAFEPEEDDDSTADRRFELKARAERSFAELLFTGVEATRASVDFGPFPTQRQWTIGADAALDTRGDPAFPANAIYLGAGWNALHHRDLDRATNRYRLDGRGYLRLIGQPVLAGRVQYLTADGPLPAHERYLVGGSDTLRAFKPGALNGTKFVVTSGELRIPITSIVSDVKLGTTIFMDAVNKLDSDDDIDDSGWRRSAGAGIFMIAPLVRINLDVARELRKGGGTRVHLSSGFSF
ncbi:MAG TPA: FtsQ-type POTRA domain-containing protein [Vicinamibacterales bacterium]|nr:FtsQ-type POTRA domain-containing protein [Vicinamibacterales bacterium]